MIRERDDIVAPDLPCEGVWIGPDPGRMDSLAAKGPVLVHFFDFAQLNSVRTLPYLTSWAEAYGPAGLRVLGVQAPRFPFGSDEEVVREGLGRLGVEFPVLIDREMRLWKDYGCEGWPSLFLWGRAGRLKWFQFGEGEYDSTERAIRESLGPSAELPDPIGTLRDTDEEGIEVIAPSGELLPGGDEPWIAERDGASFEVEYEAGGAWTTATGEGAILATVDDGPTRRVELEGPGLYELSSHECHGHHRMVIELEGNPEIWSVSFSPARSRGQQTP